ncbi:hypothetical protein J3996_gp80 [Mycobacterium phage Laurie]|uniref:Uncharacterized protein n=1 Tax=Mycobacterium phage Laurie TaxID=1874015 RepID=A0A1B2IHT7_9CAUD|nr:hypothetical protein J3996_gp80 [Mycobacterium phage Laurie]ANZ52374.1 hypothetical protein SEA_LAURIE_80 [Mycobacterium phage Laurie]
MSGQDQPRYPDVEVALVGQDGNVFAIIGRVTRALRKAGHGEACNAFTDAMFASASYDDALATVQQWVAVG